MQSLIVVTQSISPLKHASQKCHGLFVQTVINMVELNTRQSLHTLLNARVLHFQQCSDFFCIYFDSILSHREPGEIVQNHTKTLARIEFHLVPPQLAKCFFEVGYIPIYLNALDQHAINVDFHIEPNLIFEYLIDEALVSGFYIFQPKRYHFIVIQIFISCKRSLLHVFKYHSNLIVP